MSRSRCPRQADRPRSARPEKSPRTSARVRPPPSTILPSFVARLARRSAESWSNSGPQFVAAPLGSSSGNAISVCSASCKSSASRTSGHASCRTVSIASGSSRPISLSAVSGSTRRMATARARRSSSGASSRYAYGLAFRISCENGDGIGVSTATPRIVPPMSPRSTSRKPSMSIASVRTSFMTSRTSG